MSLFVSKDHIAISDDNGNTVYILPKLSFGAQRRVALHARQLAREFGQDEPDAISASLAALQEAVVGWEGRDFDRPFSPAAIEDIDLDNPFWTRVANEVAARNTSKEAGAEKKSDTNGGAPPSTGGTKARSANGTPTLQSLTATRAGSRTK